METMLKVAKKTSMGYIIKSGCLIEDTFAEMFPEALTSTSGREGA